MRLASSSRGQALTRPQRQSCRRASVLVRGVSLVELLVVVAIISILLAILAGSVGAARRTAQAFMCKNNLKTIAFDFNIFADDLSQPDRGDDADEVGFDIETFQESVYKIDDFWDRSGEVEAGFPDHEQPMICPAAPQDLHRRAGIPCGSGAVLPYINVSVAFNKRLEQVSEQIGGRWVLRPVQLDSHVLEHPQMPLAADVDGALADAQGKLPYYTAPAADDPGLFGGNRFWFPSFRHGSRVNACFIDGHVSSSNHPADAPGWDWAYQPDDRR